MSSASAPEATFRLTLAGEPTKSAIMAVQALPQYYAERDHRQWVVCMDGFDRLLKLDDDNLTFQKLCRTVWQHQRDVTYCLTGAKTMGIMFLTQRHLATLSMSIEGGLPMSREIRNHSSSLLSVKAFV